MLSDTLATHRQFGATPFFHLANAEHVAKATSDLLAHPAVSGFSWAADGHLIVALAARRPSGADALLVRSRGPHLMTLQAALVAVQRRFPNPPHAEENDGEISF